MEKDKAKKESELDRCKGEKEEYLAGWQRSRADFLNYKKEEMARISEILKYANEGLILKILPILDNLEKAANEVKSIRSEDTKNNEIIKGFLQIKKQLQDLLKNQGIEEIKSLGEKFDPNFHEVVETTESKGKEPGIIIEEVRKGYKLNGKVIRPAKIKINK